MDNYSQGTYAREDIVLTLDASGERTKMRVKTMSGEQRHLSTVVDDVEFANNNTIKQQWIKLPKNYTTSDLPFYVFIYLFIFCLLFLKWEQSQW